MSAQRAARKTAEAASSAMRIRGLPHELSAVVAALTTSAEWAPVSLETPYVAVSAPLLALIMPLGANAAHVRLRLPPGTPPKIASFPTNTATPPVIRATRQIPPLVPAAAATKTESYIMPLQPPLAIIPGRR